MKEIKDFAVLYGNQIYEIHSGGGWCHIVLDADNVSDDDVMFCIRSAAEDLHNSKLQPLELACMAMYLQLTQEERLECNRRIHDR